MSDRLQPGEPVVLAPGVRRLVAPNPGLMTGPGTNTYLFGEREVAVLDPGPDMPEHIERILEVAGAPIGWLLATHTHPDHSPAVEPLRERTGATAIGMPAPAGPHQDRTFAPDHVPTDGEVLTTDDFELAMLHTPGHASNHVCFLHQASRLLFTGDHIINGSTVVIDPPDGNMNDYLDSLGRLRNLSIDAIAGGHGELIQAPYEAIDWLVEHRLRREAKVVDTLNRLPDVLVSELVADVYDEVAPALHPVAQRSLLAHLLKLEEDGAAVVDNDRWRLVDAHPAG